MDDNPKAARDRAIADAIGRRLREIYDSSSQPVPERFATLLERLQHLEKLQHPNAAKNQSPAD